MEPTAPQERIQFLDVLRGFAILGMFSVNMTVDVTRATMADSVCCCRSFRIDKLFDYLFRICGILFALGIRSLQHSHAI
jgi:uncharacterized membrane protein YeiB